jgi:hypothetical protein
VHFPRLRYVFADSAHAGDKPESARANLGARTIDVVKSPGIAKVFVLLFRCRVVEPSPDRLSDNRDLAGISRPPPIRNKLQT